VDELALDGARELSRALGDRFTELVPDAISDRAAYYIARETASAQQVRLKVLGARTDADLELFYLESQAAAQLSHPHIVQTREAEEAGGVHFCVIAHKPGCQLLSARLKRQGWLEQREAVEIVTQLAQALEYAHESGALHLRLQPDRILLAPDGTAAISDFGVMANSRLGWASLERGQDCAPPYISPEQLAGGAPDHRSDLYALGVILYEMLTDRVPYDTRDLEQLRRKHLITSPLAPHLLSTGVPEALSGVILGLLEKQPGARFRSAAAFESALYKSLTPQLRSTVRIARPQVTSARKPVEIPPLIPDMPPGPPPPRADQFATAALDEAPPSPEAPAPLVVDDPAPVLELEPEVGETLAPPPVLPVAAFSTEPVAEKPAAPQFAEVVEPPALAAAPSAAAMAVTSVPAAARLSIPARFSPRLAAIRAQAAAAGLRSRTPVWAALVLVATTAALLLALTRMGARPQATQSEAADERALAAAVTLPTPAGAPAAPTAEPISPAYGMTVEVTPTPARSREPDTRPEAENPELKPTPQAASKPTPQAAQLPSATRAAAGLAGLVRATPREVSGAPLGPRAAEPAPPPPTSAPTPTPTLAPGPTPTSRPVQPPTGLVLGSVVRRVKPDYPVIARNAGVKGAVMVEVEVNEKGRVKSARAISGPMMLRGAAEAAARHWRFTPAMLNGTAIKVTSNITFSFQD